LFLQPIKVIIILEGPRTRPGSLGGGGGGGTETKPNPKPGFWYLLLLLFVFDDKIEGFGS
jgi:hypothetical protein